ncbi:hypothetical protein FRC0360_00462 [Corynebacterium diphtheriae]|nr:hypothetical protein FRC0360_00462 [Corynebacterium diphtheriae]
MLYERLREGSSSNDTPVYKENRPCVRMVQGDRWLMSVIMVGSGGR